MLGIFAKLMKYSRSIGIAAIVAVAIGGGWYFTNMIQENSELKSRVDQYESINQELEMALENQTKKHQAEIDAVNASMSAYMHSLSMARNTNTLLEDELKRVSKNDEELQECLNMSLPDSTIDRLRDQ